MSDRNARVTGEGEKWGGVRARRHYRRCAITWTDVCRYRGTRACFGPAA